MEEVGEFYHMITIQIRERHQLLDNFVLSPAIERYLGLFMYILAVATNNERLYKSIRGFTSPKPSARELSLSSFDNGQRDQTERVASFGLSASI